MEKCSLPTSSAAFKKISAQLSRLLVALLLIFYVSCNNAVDTKKNSGSEDSIKVVDGDSSYGKQAILDDLKFPTYKVKISDLRFQNNNKEKIVLNLFFLNFPDTAGMKLMVFPARKKEDDGRNPNLIPVTTDTGTALISPRSFSLGNSHVDLQKIDRFIRELPQTDSVVFTPLISEKNLIFKMTAYKRTNFAFEPVDLGFSNPSPPAPPGGRD